MTNQRISQLEKLVMEQQKFINKTIKDEKLQVETKTTVTAKSEAPMISPVANQSLSQYYWATNDLTCTKTLTSPGSGITSLAQKGSYIYSGTYDGTLKTYDTFSGNLLKSTKQHQLSIWGLALDEQTNKLYSGGSDGKFNVWNLENDTVSDTIDFGNQKIYSILVKDSRIFLACSDHLVHILDKHSLNKIGVLEGHSGGVNSISFVGSKLLSASSDKSVKLWDLNTLKCLNSISHTPSEVLNVKSGNNMIYTSNYDATIKVYNMNDFSMISSMSEHRWEVWQLEYADNLLFSGSHDHTIKRWDIRNFRSSLTLTGHRGYIHALKLADFGLISGCADRTIKIWS